MTCPASESLIPLAIGAGEPAIARHVRDCPACQAEVARLRAAAGVLRGQESLEHRSERTDCLDELAIADFVEGRLGPEVRARVVAHLLTCARCRSVVQGTFRLRADATLTRGATRPGWRRWSVPVGLVAAAAMVMLILWPRSVSDSGSTRGLREPALTSTVSPVPIAPRGSVGRANTLVWSGVPRADGYRLRLYDGEGSLLWAIETADTFVALPDSVVLADGRQYFWRVEAQTEYRRWAASDLVEFRLVRPSR